MFDFDTRNCVYLRNPIFDDCLLGYRPDGQTIYSLKRVIQTIMEEYEYSFDDTIFYIHNYLFEEMVNYSNSPIFFNDL